MARTKFQISLRSLILVVALAGLVMGAEVLRRRAFAFRRKAAEHTILEEIARFVPISQHGYDELSDLRFSAEISRREALAHRRKQVEAQHALDAKHAAGSPTTQTERREPWYWGMRADEAEWARREALRKLAFYQDEVAYHIRMRRRLEHAASHPWESVVDEPAPPQVFMPALPPRSASPPP